MDWGTGEGAGPSERAGTAWGAKSLVQQMQVNGVAIPISFGGLAGRLLNGCSNPGALQAGLQQVLSRVSKLAFNMEASDTVGDGPGLPVLDQALKGLKAANPNLGCFLHPSGACSGSGTR